MHRAMERWREDVGVHELGSRWQISIQFVEEYLCVIFFFFFLKQARLDPAKSCSRHVSSHLEKHSSATQSVVSPFIWIYS